MHGHGAVRYALYAVTITKLELLRTNDDGVGLRFHVQKLSEDVTM